MIKLTITKKQERESLKFLYLLDVDNSTILDRKEIEDCKILI